MEVKLTAEKAGELGVSASQIGNQCEIRFLS